MAWERDSLLHQLTLAHTHSYTCTAALPPSDDPRDEMAAGLVARMPQLAQNLPQTEVQSLPPSPSPSPPSSLLQLSVHSFSPFPFSSLLPFRHLSSLPSSFFSLFLISFVFFSLPSSFLQSSFPSFFNFSFCSPLSYHQVPWMPLPEESAPPGCPPGLEYLTQIDQILVHQLIEIFECKNLRLCTCISRLRTQHITSYIPCI